MPARGHSPDVRCSRMAPGGRRAPALLALTAALLLALAACSQELEEVPEIYQPSNAHEAYRHALLQVQLDGSALGRDWLAAADAALRTPVRITTPFRESGYFDAAQAAAMGYVFHIDRGQRIDAEVQIEAREPLRVFMDLFRLADDDPQAPVHVASGATPVEPLTATVGAPGPADGPLENLRRLRLEPLRDGTYLLRVQPELLRTARYTVRIVVDASLAFPVADHSTRSIQSNFGAERDAGRRSHHGVDIFAPRGTPVLAASDGVVTRVETTPVGGNVVWVNDAHRSLRLYYAHLDSQTVERGQRVLIGDQLGTVGNTGNAITTPTHLHFGVYARGPVDPSPFLRRLDTEPQQLTADPGLLGSWSRTAAAEVAVLAGPQRRAAIVGALARHTPVRLWGASAAWYRVGMPDGSVGYVAAATLEPATPLRREPLRDTVQVLDRPGARGTVIDELAAGVELPVLGSFGDFLYVQTPAGRTGWLSFD